MPSDLKQQLAQMREQFERQSDQFAGVRRALNSLDPDTVLSIRKEWLEQLDEVTKAPRRGLCIHPMGIRA
jgi:hypothetical protein